MKEEEIRPQAVFDEYLRLASEDTTYYFSDVERIHGGCPACNGAGTPAFDKAGFRYEQCPDCLTLYVNPRPLASAFSRYYTESPSSKYWASTFYRETAVARREKLWKPKARSVYDIIGSQNPAAFPMVVDIGGGYGLFAEEMSLLTGESPIVIEPGPDLACVCREKGLTVVEKFLEDVSPADLPDVGKVFVSFELFEHLHDPHMFMKHLHGLMSSGDIFLFTTLSGTGVDIMVLWGNSKSVMPPHHLNFFNPQSILLLLDRCGFDTVKVTTPGKLDIDIIANNQVHVEDRFWKTFVQRAGESEKQSMQDSIAANGWSSHMMVVCRKP
jgi:hypothetical protein